MAGRRFADQADRDRILQDLGATLFVEAGAGTGKTTALVGRIVELLAGGHTTAPRLAAITFTEKAAAELRDRLRRELERAVRPEGGRTPAAVERCRAALDELDQAAVCTLHAFAQRILQARPLEAGLPPAFDVQDDVQSSLGFQDRWDAWLDGFLSDSRFAPLVRLLLTLGLKLDQARDLAGRIHENWDRIGALPAAPPPLPAIPDARPVIEALSDALALAGKCRSSEDRMLGHLQGLAPYLLRLRNAGPGMERLKVLAEPRSLKHTFGQRENWPPGLLQGIRDTLAHAQDERDALLAGLRTDVLPPLLYHLQQFALDWAADRRREGALQFHDLLVVARDLLRDRPDVRAAVRQHWTHLLIDEFQDTDPLQAEIAVLLTGRDVDTTGWERAAVEPGALFFVGDPKQSIYRFRRADVELYRGVQARFTAGAAHLTQNFRSVAGVVDWVNAVFPALFGQTAGVQPSYTPLVAERAAVGPRVRVLGGPSDASNVDVLRAQEAGDIVFAIRGAKARGWQVADSHHPDHALRPVRYADMALLIPTRTALPAIEQALEEGGVPYRVESRSLVFGSREVHDLLSVLAAIDDPTDQVALIAALRSPIYACSDNDLLSFYQAGGRWDYTHPVASGVPAGHPVASAFASLEALNRQRAWLGVAGVVERVAREREVLALAFAHRRPRDAWTRLRFVVDQARAFQEAGGATLRQFVDWVERQAEEDRAIVETVAPEQDDDAVRIMTVHAAKGLEFPVVFLAGLNVQPRKRTQNALWRPSGELEVRLGNRADAFETPGYEALEQLEQDHQRAEQHRLLYVACTRARDYLVLSLWHLTGKPCHAHDLWELCQAQQPPLWEGLTTGPIGLELEPAASFDDTPEQRAAWMDERTALLARPSPGRPIAATAIAHQAAKDEPVEELPAWRRGRAGTSIGRAVHSALQSVDLASGAGVAEVAAAQAAAEGVPGRAAEVQRLVEAALSSEAVREAVAADRYWREVYVSSPVAGRVVEGFIDLLYESPDGLVVVDYKTDSLAQDADAVAAMQRYRWQGAAYALALQQTLGRPVARVVFVFVRSPDLVEVPVPDLPAAMADVAGVVAATL